MENKPRTKYGRYVAVTTNTNGNTMRQSACKTFWYQTSGFTEFLQRFSTLAEVKAFQKDNQSVYLHFIRVVDTKTGQTVPTTRNTFSGIYTR